MAMIRVLPTSGVGNVTLFTLALGVETREQAQLAMSWVAEHFGEQVSAIFLPVDFTWFL